MYQVASHHFGRKVIKTGPMSGCLGFEEHEWRGLGFSRSKQKAIALANSASCRATVVIAYTATVVYDNGKPPGPR